MKKLIKELIKDLESKGWRIELRRGGHYVAYPKDRSKPQVTFSATPSDVRAYKNIIATLRRSGYTK